MGIIKGKHIDCCTSDECEGCYYEPSAASASYGQWQPIETSPKDGTHILGWHKVWKCPVAVYWKDDAEMFPVLCKWLEVTLTTAWPAEAFTHWMPVPEGP